MTPGLVTYNKTVVYQLKKKNSTRFVTVLNKTFPKIISKYSCCSILSIDEFLVFG